MTGLFFAAQTAVTSAAFAYIVYMYMFSRHNTGRHIILDHAMMPAFIGSLGYTVMLLSETADAALVSYAFSITGGAFSLYLIYCFVKQNCGLTVPRYVSIALLIMDIFGCMTALTDGRFHLFFSCFGIGSDGFWFIPEIEAGPGFVIMIASMLIQSALIIVFTVYSFGSYKHSIIVCISAVMPVAARILFVTDVTGGYDLSPMFAAAGCIAVSFSVRSGGVSDMVSSARNSVIETMDDALLVTDTRMNIVDANPAAKRIFPEAFEANANKRTRTLLVRNLIGDGEQAEIEINGKYYEKHISQLFNNDGSAKGYALLILDITDTKRYVDELIDMRQKADMANSAKSDFLANMSHEIRTPMNAITGFAELCLREQDYRYASDIKAAAKNLISIINDILDISKIEAGKLELVSSVYDTEDMLGDVISIIYMQLDEKEGVAFKTDIDKRLPKRMYGDEVRIKQILINLLNNAVKFTKAGTISFTVRELSRSGDKISLMFKVADTGIGIKKEDMSKLFTNFQQVDTKKNREIEGTGLGLSISKNLISMMDGSITVESEYGKGSTFTAVIWQKVSDFTAITGTAAAAAAPQSDDGEKTLTVSAPNAKVLIVDDNKVNLNVTSHILSMYGINAAAADSGREAIAKINSEYYDLVFMDHMMPELDGVDTTKIIRSQGDAYSKELPIVALTANAVSGAKEMFLESGFNDFISKPIQLPQLEKILVEWLPKQMVTYVDSSNNAGGNSMSLMDIISEGDENDGEREEEFIIPDIDVEAGLALCGNSTDAYLAVLKTFMETAEESIERIERFSRERNYKDYVTEVHGLKSSALAIGAKGLSEMARQLEMAGREENYKQISYETPTLIAKYTEIAENIKPFTEGEPSEAENDSDKPPIERSFMKSSLEAALEAIDDLDSPEVIRILDSILEYRLPRNDIREEVENCRRYTDNFAYEKAEAGIRHILENI